MKFKVGDIVASNQEGYYLHCSHWIYNHAVVISADPLILASESSDMRWTKMDPDKLVKVSTASEEVLNTAMRRIDE